MDKKSKIFMGIFIVISLAVFTSVSFAEVDVDFSIPFANIHLYIQEDGNLHVVETIHYSFSSDYRGVDRTIPYKSGEKIDNLNVTTKNAYSRFTVSDNGNQKYIKVYLYSNPEKTEPSTNKDIEVTYEYDFINVIKLYNDVATLQYNLWGDEWSVDLGRLNTYVYLNDGNSINNSFSNNNSNNNIISNSISNNSISNNIIDYWLNPKDFVLSEKWNNNTLEVSTKKINSGNIFELRMLLPKDYFNNPIYASIYGGNGKENFLDLQKAYENEYNFFSSLYNVLIVIMIILAGIPLLIYLLFGREPKISYQGIYEREPPTNDPPAVVNALYKGNVGSTDMDGFKATILDLVNKKYLKMENFKSSYKTLDDGEKIKTPSISFNDGLDISNLKNSEKSALNVLKIFSNNENKLDLNKFENDMQNEVMAKKFRDHYNSWSNDVENEATVNIENLFISKGYNLALVIGILGIILSGVSIFSIFVNFIPTYIPPVSLLFYISILLMIVSFITVSLPNHVFGHWTQKGKENNDKWQKFKKYLKDFSLIKEHPPESIVIWNDYLVYATALGVAKSVQKAMEKIIPRETLDSSDSYIFYNYGGTYLLFSSFDSGISTATSSDSGGMGGGNFGGGSGGGGGGAF